MEFTFASTIKKIISIANKVIYQIKGIAIVNILESNQELLRRLK